MPTQSKAFPGKVDTTFPPGKCDRKNIRYWLFRKQNELLGGAKAKGAPRGLYAQFEDQPSFILAGGYKTFADTWDVGSQDPLSIIPRHQSITEEWNRHLDEAAVPLPLVGRG